jgi:hypothetical protein
MPMKFTEDNVLRVEHRLIKEQLIMECPVESKADLLAYIAGVNDMAEYVIDAMREIAKQ